MTDDSGKLVGPVTDGGQRIQSERQAIRAACRPAAGEGPLNSLAARHVLEPGSPNHREEEALRATLPFVTPDFESEKDRQSRIRLMFRRAFLRPRLSYDDLEPYRVRVAWRWVREVALMKSLVGDDQQLSDALLGGNDPWHNGNVGHIPTLNSWLKLRGDVVEMMNEPDGLPLLPPRPPAEWCDDQGVVLDSYDPSVDRGLVAWLKAFDRVTQYLGVMRGSPDNPDEGRYGLYGMLDPDTVRLCFPSPVQILLWEDVLVRETWNHMIHSGQKGAEEALYAVYGLHDTEIARVIRLARTHGERAYTTDLEADRALLCARLEDLALRCREGVPDERAELQCYKAIAVIKGVTRSEADDYNAEVSSIIQRISRDAGGPKVIDVPSEPLKLPPFKGG